MQVQQEYAKRKPILADLAPPPARPPRRAFHAFKGDQPSPLPSASAAAAGVAGVEYGFNARGEIQLEKKDDMKKRGLASPDIADALALTFALPVTAGWDLPPVQAYCETEYDLYRDFDEDYWDAKDEFDE